MNNVNVIYELWVKFFYGNEENYISWLKGINDKLNNYHFPSWIMDLINALPYIATFLSFIFVIYLFYLIILTFKCLINAINEDGITNETPETPAPNAINRSDEKVKTYYYFSKKPGRKKRRY